MNEVRRLDEVIELDELEVRIIVDNETDTLSSVDEGVPQVPELVDLVRRTPATRDRDGHECKVALDDLCCACHGFSVLLTGRRGRDTRCLLFDVGPNTELWFDNARRVGLSLRAVDYVFLSHWHFDHSGALAGVLTAISRARTAANLQRPILDVHPQRPDQRGILQPSGTMILLPIEPTLEALAGAGAEVVSHDDPHTLCDGFFFASGAVERVTEYETGLAGHYSYRGSTCESDPLIRDERFIAASVRGRGITIVSACSHAGIINVCLQARRYFPAARIDVVLGGYHLAGKSMEERIAPTVRDLVHQINPRIVAPGHCTGWRAKAQLANAFSPGRYAPSVVGSRYRLSAVPDATF